MENSAFPQVFFGFCRFSWEIGRFHPVFARHAPKTRLDTSLPRACEVDRFYRVSFGGKLILHSKSSVTDGSRYTSGSDSTRKGSRKRMHSNIQNANPSAHPTPPEPVPLEQVLRVAELAQLELTLDEQQEMLRDLNAILGHVAQLNELDTRDVPAMTQVNATVHADANVASESQGSIDSGNVLREDAPRPSLDRGRVMAAAPESDGTYFKVPKVIER